MLNMQHINVVCLNYKKGGFKMKNLIFCAVVSLFLLGGQQTGIFEEVAKAVNNTKEAYSQVKQLTKANDLTSSISNFGDQINQVNKTIDDNFALLDKLEQQNKAHNRG